jgi:small subunit ribosomal protein S13
MAYILGATIPDNKSIITALQKIYGVGLNKSTFICKNIGLTSKIRTFELTEKQKYALVQFAEKANLLFESDLIRLNADAKKRLVTLRIFRGIRSKQGFPVRGQRTHTNGKTAKKNLNKNGKYR